MDTLQNRQAFEALRITPLEFAYRANFNYKTFKVGEHPQTRKGKQK